jgi:hypothetical protein
VAGSAEEAVVGSGVEAAVGMDSEVETAEAEATAVGSAAADSV